MAFSHWTHAPAVLAAVCIATSGCDRNEDKGKMPPPGAHPNRGNVPVQERDATSLKDQDVTRAVESALERDPGVEEGNISVKTANGIVELTGRVEDLLSKRRATMMAEGVKGVRSVSDRIALDLKMRPDADLQRDVKNALLVDAAADSFEIDVKAKEGAVTLTGNVQSWQELKLAERLAEGVRGVREVRNELRIEYPKQRSDSEIGADVRSSFRWDRLLNDGLVDVQVKDGKVTLKGVVGSAAERRRAYRNAWVNGAKSVDDSAIEVQYWAKEDDLRKNKFVKKPDAEIADAIRDANALDPRVDSGKVDVEVETGIATLSGKVESPKARMAAESIARHTVGVLSVKNELEVKPGREVADSVIKRNLRNALLHDPTTDSFEIDVAVNDGTVTLKGKVETSFERAQAGDLAAGIQGVKRIENQIEIEDPKISYIYHWYLDPYVPFVEKWHYHPVTPARSDAEILDDIKAELTWSPFVDADDVTVTVAAGKATLIGSVDSDAERAAAVENAYEGGAIAVDDRLRVDTKG